MIQMTQAEIDQWIAENGGQELVWAPVADKKKGKAGDLLPSGAVADTQREIEIDVQSWTHPRTKATIWAYRIPGEDTWQIEKLINPLPTTGGKPEPYITQPEWRETATGRQLYIVARDKNNNIVEIREANASEKKDKIEEEQRSRNPGNKTDEELAKDAQRQAELNKPQVVATNTEAPYVVVMENGQLVPKPNPNYKGATPAILSKEPVWDDAAKTWKVLVSKNGEPSWMPVPGGPPPPKRIVKGDDGRQYEEYTDAETGETKFRPVKFEQDQNRSKTPTLFDPKKGYESTLVALQGALQEVENDTTIDDTEKLRRYNMLTKQAELILREQQNLVASQTAIANNEVEQRRQDLSDVSDRRKYAESILTKGTDLIRQGMSYTRGTPEDVEMGAKAGMAHYLLGMELMKAYGGNKEIPRAILGAELQRQNTLTTPMLIAGIQQPEQKAPEPEPPASIKPIIITEEDVANMDLGRLGELATPAAIVP